MTAFSSLLTDFRASAPNYEIEIDENWKQGRTAYGGLTAALLHVAIVDSLIICRLFALRKSILLARPMAECGSTIKYSDAAKTT